jgi:beta-carotene 3-hydroxylase
VSALAFAAATGLSFVAMEGVSYVAHRWVMHRFGMGWHRSHHRPPTGGLERNDLFPACFSMVGVALFALATTGPAIAWLLPVAVGVSLYGAAYLVVHEICIHERVAVPVPRGAYARWLRASHALHHRFGGEPYGMLLPVVPRALRARGEEVGAQPTDVARRVPARAP